MVILTHIYTHIYNYYIIEILLKNIASPWFQICILDLLIV